MANYMSIAEALYKAGAELQRQAGKQSIPRRDLARRTIALTGCSYESVLLSDYCYNLVNRAPVSCSDPFFVQEGRGGLSYSRALAWRQPTFGFGMGIVLLAAHETKRVD